MSSAAMPDEGLLPGLGYLAAALTAALSKLAEEKFSLYGVAPVQYAILDTCSNGQVNTVMGLTKVIPMDQASISRHVAALAERGLIQRTRQQKDRQVVLLALTDEGRDLAFRLTESLREANPLAAMGAGRRGEEALLEGHAEGLGKPGGRGRQRCVGG